MAQIIEFPKASEREWRMWEEVLRETHKGDIFDGEILEAALPRIKGHWDAIFQSKSIPGAPTKIPGPITEDQLIAINAAVNAHVMVAVDALKAERLVFMGRLVGLELQIGYFRKHGFD